MALKPRLHLPGGLYHVILRGNARQDVFFAPGDRSAFYALLAECVVRFGYRVHAFCLMTKHVHLALHAGESPLSAGMQNLGFRYTRYLNTRLSRVGHVFQGRFKAYLVDQDKYGLALVSTEQVAAQADALQKKELVSISTLDKGSLDRS